jgi:hypothetical protein
MVKDELRFRTQENHILIARFLTGMDEVNVWIENIIVCKGGSVILSGGRPNEEFNCIDATSCNYTYLK